jgi:hypothetical protein
MKERGRRPVTGVFDSIQFIADECNFFQRDHGWLLFLMFVLLLARPSDVGLTCSKKKTWENDCSTDRQFYGRCREIGECDGEFRKDLLLMIRDDFLGKFEREDESEWERNLMMTFSYPP